MKTPLVNGRFLQTDDIVATVDGDIRQMETSAHQAYTVIETLCNVTRNETIIGGLYYLHSTHKITQLAFYSLTCNCSQCIHVLACTLAYQLKLIKYSFSPLNAFC